MQTTLNLHADTTEAIIEKIDKSLSIMHHMMKRLVKNNDREHMSNFNHLRYQVIPAKEHLNMHVFELNYGETSFDKPNQPDNYTVGVVIDEEGNFKFYKNSYNDSIITKLKENGYDNSTLNDMLDYVKPEAINYLDDDRRQMLYQTITAIENDYYGTFETFLIQDLAQREYDLRHMFDKSHKGMNVLVEIADDISSNDDKHYEWHRLPNEDLENDGFIQIVNYNAPFRITRDDSLSDLNQFVKSCQKHNIKTMLDLKLYLQKIIPLDKIPSGAVYKNKEEVVNNLLKGEPANEVIKKTKNLDPKQPYFQVMENDGLVSLDQDEVEGDCEVGAGDLLALYFDKVLNLTDSSFTDKDVERNPVYDMI